MKIENFSVADILLRNFIPGIKVLLLQKMEQNEAFQTINGRVAVSLSFVELYRGQ